VLALASTLDCREGQAYSLFIGAFVAAVLLALGLPPVLSHRPAALAAPPPAESLSPPSTFVAVAPPATPETTLPPPSGAPLSLPPAAAPFEPPPVLALPPLATAAGEAPMTGTGGVLRGQEGTVLLSPVAANGQVALVSNAPGRRLTATVNWGDGTLPTKGDVAGTSAESFQVSGSHVYEEDGTYRITVTITDDRGSVLVVLSEARIADPPDALDQALDRADDGG
jgi:hypothetical protein